jgi:predicted metalloprotease with PDZ domain
LEISNVAGKTQVDKVLRGASASQAGVQAGDELIALDGYRIGAEQWAERVGLLRVGQEVSVLVSRRGKILELPLKILDQPDQASTPSWTLVRAEKPTPEQEKRWNLWLNVSDKAQANQQSDQTK